MDLTQLLAWIVGANTIITFATTVYNLMSTRATKALKAIENVEAKIAKLGEDRQTAGEAMGERFQSVEFRLLKIEADLEHIPSRDHAHKMELAVAQLIGSMKAMDERLTGKIETLDERLKPVVATSARLQNYLMEQGAEK